MEINISYRKTTAAKREHETRAKELKESAKAEYHRGYATAIDDVLNGHYSKTLIPQ
jgi:hypothetical protein